MTSSHISYIYQSALAVTMETRPGMIFGLTLKLEGKSSELQSEVLNFEKF